MTGTPIGIFGGTFDPPHYGHLRPALELAEGLDMEQMHMLPANMPPHRPQPEASAQQRLAMLRLAVADEPRLVVDERELQRPGPSYMADTLQSLRDDYPDTPLCLCLGMDAFLQLHRWHQWQRIAELAHIVVAHRPGWALGETPLMAAELAAWYTSCRVDSPEPLRQALAGRVWLQQVSQLAISATEIRRRIAAGLSVRYLLPEPVWHYIQQQQLYSK